MNSLHFLPYFTYQLLSLHVQKPNFLKYTFNTSKTRVLTVAHANSTGYLCNTVLLAHYWAYEYSVILTARYRPVLSKSLKQRNVLDVINLLYSFQRTASVV
jgi:hypothetical protein